MLLRRRGWLKKEYDRKLLAEVYEAKTTWEQQKTLIHKSFDPSAELIEQVKTAEAIYFSLLNEAKNRNVRIPSR
ncbi:MAG TPA: YaaL family protein [Bacillus sp. (in: firmicutes)]|uniref:YaaL family protein n=1 Tax=Bacillus litorisediminis TaxID=2922713 RepID=UPI001FADF859|nr:YaaL family protein [Bacillus litorisediminis]HWO78656.1 YaaL family protein [Bacillus sp. (in: firmicutes)]